jgi:hypothetical protein
MQNVKRGMNFRLFEKYRLTGRAPPPPGPRPQAWYTVCTVCKASKRDYYCKRPILCLSSSKILTPHPPSPPGECVPGHRLCCAGRTHSPGGEGGGGSIFWKAQDTTLYSTYIESSLEGVVLTRPLNKLVSSYGRQ